MNRMWLFWSWLCIIWGAITIVFPTVIPKRYYDVPWFLGPDRARAVRIVGVFWIAMGLLFLAVARFVP